MNYMKKMLGQIPVEITGCGYGSEDMKVTMQSGDEFVFYHYSDCCESVQIEQVDGDFKDLIGSPLLLAEEVEGETPSDYKFDYEPESYTWTFYRFATVKGYLNVRWLGTSNGYYGESVTVQVNGKDQYE